MPNQRLRDFVFYSALALAVAACAVALWAPPAISVWPIHGVRADTFESVAAGFSSVATGTAVAVGGGWAYFKVLRGRTFHPRFGIQLDGEWRRLESADVLHVRITVTNIGTTKISLNQFGSGLKVGFPASVQDSDVVTWDLVESGGTGSDGNAVARVFEVLTEHEWIEPGQVVYDDLLLNLGRTRDVCMLEATLMGDISGKNHGKYSGGDVEFFARRILAQDAKITDKVA